MCKRYKHLRRNQNDCKCRIKPITTTGPDPSTLPPSSPSFCWSSSCVWGNSTSKVMMREPRMLMLSKFGRPSPFFHIRAPGLVILSLTIWTCEATTDAAVQFNFNCDVSNENIWNKRKAVCTQQEVENLVSVQMHDVHLEADQRLHQGDGDVGVQVVSSAFKHRMSEEKSIKTLRYCVTNRISDDKGTAHSELSWFVL